MMMMRWGLAGAILLVAGCASSPGGPGGREHRQAPTSPSDLVTAEIAFNRLAQEKGQWTAFSETASQDAIMFTPQITNAQSWLKGRANPAQSVRWQTHKVFIACDGTLGVTTGAAQWPDGRQGYFTTIWRRKDKSRATQEILKQWEWVLDTGGQLQTPLEAPEWLETRVASCKGQPGPAEPTSVDMNAQHHSGSSKDQSLRWYAASEANGAHTLYVNIWDGTNMIPVIENKQIAE